MGADGELVRARRTEVSFISTKKPFVFFEKSIEVLKWKPPGEVAPTRWRQAGFRRLDAHHSKIEGYLQGESRH